MPGLLTGLRLLLHGGVDTRLVWVRLWAARRRTMGLTLGAAVVAVAASFLVPYWYPAETTTNPRTGMVTFKLEGPSKTVAKLMADTAFAALNQLAIAIRRRRATAERQFLEGRWQALSDSLQGREDALRRFYERNRNVAS